MAAIKKILNGKVSLLGLSFSMVLFTSLYCSKQFMDPFLEAQHAFAMLAGSISLLIAFIYFIFKKQKLSYTVNKLDISVFIFGVYLLMHESLSGKLFTNNTQLLNILLCIGIYFVYLPIFKKQIGSVENKSLIRTILSICIIIGIIQPIYGFLEFFNAVPKMQNEFPIGGAFGNPGSYANFLVTLLPISIFSVLHYKNGFLKYGGIVSSILILAILPLTLARTSWIAAIIALIFISLTISRSKVIFRLLSKNRNLKIVSFLTIVTIFLGLFIGLSKFKQDSANGRLFIWNISTKIIKDKPLFGHGISLFSPIHNQYQAEYFRVNPDDTKNGYIAECVNSAFNEFIQFSVEIGLVGLMFFLVILIISIEAFYKSKNKPNSKMSITIIIVIMVCSLFSYPLHSIPTLFLFFMALLLMSSVIPSYKINFASTQTAGKIFSTIGFIIMIMWLSVSISRFNAEKEWKKAFIMARKGLNNEAKLAYSNLFDKLQYNQYFLFNYGAELTIMGKHKESITILNKAKDKVFDTELNIYLGVDYTETGELDKALSCFKKASEMMPIKYIPKYQMVIINEKLGNTTEAIRLANIIIDMPIKVPSELVNQIKKEMQIFLKDKNHSIE